ncbi:hypothetical protein RclHR1_00070015 [Rhizophagus clarus]|uniref:NADAR family protein n=1 Tax=Rhizophagus clarus TaxID=94130 RepID=A0A2Z6RU79_9GLOM|nr:hypothetical protein RclHR1_00070015 [Rhizophagus clarus]GES78188.1 NADAR family protein [Rhizophagus clarus]
MMDIDTETTVSYLKNNKRKIESHFEEPYNQPRKSMRVGNKTPFRLSQDDYLQIEIDKMKKARSKDENFELLSLDTRKETSSDNYDRNNNNKDVAQLSVNDEILNTEIIDEQPAIYSRQRKKKKNYVIQNSKFKRLVNNFKENNVQNDVGKYNQSHIEENTITDHPNIKTESDFNNIKRIESDENRMENSNPCGCQPLLSLPCDCSKSIYKKNDEKIDYEMIIKEDIPDKNLGIIKRVTKVIYNMVHGYESDEPSDEPSDGDMSNQTKSASSRLKNVFYKFLKQFDPFPPNSPPYTPSNLTVAFQHMDLQSSLNNLLVIIITFDRQAGQLDIQRCHLLGYHPIYCHFSSPRIDEYNALNFVYDSIMNCWANSWKVALAVFGEAKELGQFFEKIREKFESEILEIIFIQPLKSPYSFFPTRCFNRLHIRVAKDSNTATWKDEYHRIIQNVVQKANRDRDKIFFYNKDEPYYEFTNFYRVPIWKGDEKWPSTEHYFQAAKFEDRFLRRKIRSAYSAREAFTIARQNDFQKRKDWESPKPPDNMIYKEGVMKEALFLKFTQHEKLKNKLLSTGKVEIFEHTENDRYWGDGGRNNNGLNKLGIMLQDLRKILMEDEKARLMRKYHSHRHQKWFLSKLKELKQFDDLIEFDDDSDF